MGPSLFFSYPVYDTVIIFKKYPLSRAPPLPVKGLMLILTFKIPITCTCNFTALVPALYSQQG